MNILINYADETFRHAQKLNTWTSKHLAGFDKVIEYCPASIDPDFKAKNDLIFKYKRGNGLWLWKPYLIKKTLQEMNSGDKLFYLDSGAFWTRNARPLLKLLDLDDVVTFDLPLIEKQFTKASTFSIMDCTSEIYFNTNQIQATMFGLKQGRYASEFVDKWLSYCCNIDNIAPDINSKGIDHTYISHREDQSILSLLCKKENVQPYLDPTQYGRMPEKYRHSQAFIFKIPAHSIQYPPLIAVHRSKDVNVEICIKQWLCCLLPRQLLLYAVRNATPKGE